MIKLIDVLRLFKEGKLKITSITIERDGIVEEHNITYDNKEYLVIDYDLGDENDPTTD